MPPLIEFREVYKIYKTGGSEVYAVNGVSFSVDTGEFVAIIGQSGSGKSTCMNILGCLDVPTRGNYFLNGIDVSALTDNELAKLRNATLGFIFQQYNLLPKLNVIENVKLPLLYRNLKDHVQNEYATAALKRVGLEAMHHKRPSQLSGGEQQRVSIARALAGDPSIILADEPTGALDSKTGAEVLKFLKELNKSGNTVVLITHDNDIAAQAPRIIRLHDGDIVYDGEVSGDEIIRKRVLNK